MTLRLEDRIDLDLASVRDAMRAPVHTCSADTPLTEVAEAMMTHGVHAIVVELPPSRAERWTVLSALDLAEAAASGAAATAGDVAATEPVTVSAGDSLRRAAQLMAEHGVSHLLVRDGADLSGIVSTTDITRACARGSDSTAPALAHGPIVVGVDGSERGDDAVALARTLLPALGGRLILANAVAALGVGRGGGAYEPAARAEALRIVGAAAPDLGPEVAETRVVDCLGRSRGLLDLTDDVGASALVLGSCHRGAAGRVLIGSLADALVSGIRCPLIVAPRGYRSRPRPLRRIGVGYDATPGAERALDFAIGLARATGASLRLWCAVAPTGAEGRHPERNRDFTRYIHAIAHRQLADGLARLPAGLRATTAVLEGSPAHALAAAAQREGADLVVVGARGHGVVERMLVGNTARRLTHSAPAPVAVVPARSRHHHDS
jgi:nucleotide-binding universal stress UspA family protein